MAIAGTLYLPACAAELAGVVMPEQVTVDGKTLVLNGLGLREATFLRVDVYVAGLYLEEKSQDADKTQDSSHRVKNTRFPRSTGLCRSASFLL